MLRFLHKMGSDATWQLHFHGWFSLLWFTSIILVPVWYHPFDGPSWLALGIMEVSLWSNFATHFGAVSSAIAARAARQTPDPIQYG